VSDSIAHLLRSSRISTATREALQSRRGPDDPRYVPTALPADAAVTLRAVLDRVIPSARAYGVDLAARIDRRLASGAGDGWRHASLPPDRDMYCTGLHTIDRWARLRHGVSFVELAHENQDLLLLDIDAGATAQTADVPRDSGDLTRQQMRLWFEELRVDAVRLYAGLPATFVHIGYSGFANGGDGMPKSGFSRVGLNERETWEPSPDGEADL
jgi:hypothetical protein